MKMKIFKYAILLLLPLCIPTILRAKMIEVKNAFVKIGVDDISGRFTMSTLDGDPSTPDDDNKNLLHYKIPPPSFTTILIDDEPYIFGSTRGSYKQRAEAQNNKIVTEWTVRGINIQQIVEIVKGPSTGRDDTMRVFYKIRNETATKSKIGVRIVLDTELSDKKGAAFRLPELGDVTHETQFYRDSIPAFWHTFDSFEDPKVKAQGILKDYGATIPDRIIFANWSRLYDNPWEYVVDPNKFFNNLGTQQYDGAMALYYNPIESKSIYIVALFGLYGVSFFSSKDLNMSMSLPPEPKAPPIPVTVELKNNGTQPLDRLQLTIETPFGFDLAEGETTSKEFLKVAPGDSSKIIWHLVTKKKAQGTFEVNVKANAFVGTKVQDVTATKSFSINYSPLQDITVTNVDITKELEKEIEKKVVAATNTNMIVSTTNTNGTIATNVATTHTTTVVRKEESVISDEEKILMREIDDLDKLIREVDTKYEILIGTYKNSYISNTAVVNYDLNLKYYQQKLSQQEQILSNQLSGEFFSTNTKIDE